MVDTTVKELAESVGIPVDRLLVQLTQSGLPHDDADQQINDEDKAQLLSHLRRIHGKGEGESAAPKKISLKRRSVRELKISSPQGRRKTVTVEVRKRRTIVRALDPDSADASEPDAERPAGETDAERMAAAKRALHEEAKRRPQKLDDALRAEDLVREQRAKERLEEEEENRRANREREADEERRVEKKLKAPPRRRCRCVGAGDVAGGYRPEGGGGSGGSAEGRRPQG